MEGIKSTITNLIIVALFAIALIAFAIRFGDVNDSAVSVDDDPAVGTFKTNLEQIMGNFTKDQNESETSFGQTIPEAGGDSILMLSVANIWKTLVSAPKAVYSLTVGLIFDKLFGDSGFYIFFTTIGVLLAASIVFYAWRWIKSGEP